MIYKKAFFILIMLVLNIVMVTAAANTWEDTIYWKYYWSMDDTNTSGNTMQNSVPGGVDGTITNTKTGRTSKVNEGYYFDGTGDYVQFNDYIKLNQLNFSVSFWFNTNQTVSAATQTKAIVFYNSSAGYYGFVIEQLDDQNMSCFLKDVSANSLRIKSNFSLNDGNWHHLMYTYNSTQAQLYIDGKFHTSGELDISDDIYTKADWHRLGSTGSGSKYWTGHMDEIAVWNKTIGYDEQLNIYNHQDSGQRLDAVSDTIPPNISLEYPSNETHVNADNYNGSIILNITESGSCTLNDTDWTLTNSDNTRFLFDNTAGLLNTNYTITVTCEDDVGNSKTTEFWFTYDNIMPIISTNIVNNSYYTSPLNLNVDYSDIYLYRTNTTIYNATDIQYNNYSGELTGNDTYYNVSASVTLTEGTYNILMQAADTHTTKTLAEAKAIYKDNSKLSFYMQDDTNIRIENLGSADITTNKLKDRYTWIYSFHKTNQIQKFIVTSDNGKVTYLPDSPYPGHFIIADRYWVDFAGIDSKLKITKSGDNRYTVTTLAPIASSASLRSLGGLNNIDRLYTVLLDNNPPQITSNSTETTSSSLSFSLTYSEQVNITYFLASSGCGGIPITQDSRNTYDTSDILLFNTGLTTDNTYYLNTTITDSSGKQANDCITASTNSSAASGATSVTVNVDNTRAIVIFSILFIWVLLFITAYLRSDFVISMFMIIYGIFASVYLYTIPEFPQMIASLIGIFNLILLYIALKQNR